MKSVFVLKITNEGMVGYYDGQTNWDADVYKAMRFDSYPEAEQFLKNAFTLNGWGGMIQIEKYFINSNM